MDARISIPDNDRKRGERSISRALDLANEHELPLATWRVHATAALLLGHDHARSASEHILEIARSLPEGHPLRTISLSSNDISAVLSQIDIAHSL
jgi:hypothetical protein